MDYDFNTISIEGMNKEQRRVFNELYDRLTILV